MSCICHRKIENISNYRLEMMPIYFVNHPGAADTKIQPKSLKFLLDMRYFCNFSLVSLGIRPRSRRCAERTRQGEGRRSRPPKPALERSDLTENSSSANRILRPRRKKSPDRIPETKEWFYLYVWAHPRTQGWKTAQWYSAALYTLSPPYLFLVDENPMYSVPA